MINALLSSFEMGIVAVRHGSLDYLEKHNVAHIGAVRQMKANLERTLSSVQVGITIVSIVSGTMVGFLAGRFSHGLLEPLGLGPNWAAMTAMTILEPVSKILFRHRGL